MFETRGRKNLEAYVDGGYYIVKKPINFAGSLAVVLPKDWLESISLGRKITYFLLDPKDTQMTIKLFFGELPGEAS